MQDRNKSSHTPPRSGDGTQPGAKKADANWYGQNQVPQEEFIENDPSPNQNHGPADHLMSEGKPSLGRGADDGSGVTDHKTADVRDRH